MGFSWTFLDSAKQQKDKAVRPMEEPCLSKLAVPLC